jgi:hydroxyacylglutathione hydrolase
MIIEQFYLEGLGHASYLVGSEKTGEALLFDVRRDVDAYFDVARNHQLRVTSVCDSHGHNDYLSGLSEVSARAGVEVWGSAEADFGYDHRPVSDGDRIEMGEVGIEVLHTPGHTPEHISLLLYDGDQGDEPAILLSGGALLVGDLARPDLLGDREETEESAREYCRTIQTKLLELPDYVLVYPTHVAGSLCGGSIGSRLSTTVGYERRTNEILAKVSSADEFVQSCLDLENLPAVPPYWRRMRAQNLGGVDRLGTMAEPPALTAEQFEDARDHGAWMVDCRSPEAYGGGHVPGAVNVGLGSSFATWAGTVLPEDADTILILDSAAGLWEATWHLLRIGYPAPKGWLAGGMMAWRTTGRDIDQLEQITVHQLLDRVDGGDVDVLDVRQPAEWADGHIDGATFITGAELPRRLDDVPSSDRPLVVVCGSGYRSSVSASFIAHERPNRAIINVLGGMGAWNAAGYLTTN